jgi:hypothetical protein
MSPSHPIVAASEEFERAAKSYETQSMKRWGSDLPGVPTALENVARGLRAMAQRSDDQDPLKQSIIETLHSVAKIVDMAADTAKELPATFKTLHSDRLDRLEAPLKGPAAEAKWDIRAGDD